ncbi:hypothetical protein L6164_011112 [Bauhinia variegata]|uniref:Uncharacterized protein n=1 Tax=Bauhinia variegata TaxID=167791 RepID=A0ACB9P775_BAUVA|nr:hypothetical protein L6164_011112 [Bauhinia variegata]
MPWPLTVLLKYQLQASRLNIFIVRLLILKTLKIDLGVLVLVGIVRGIDTVKGVLYVITPLPQSSLEKVNLLMQGFIQIPTCLLQVQGCVSPYMSSSDLTVS